MSGGWDGRGDEEGKGEGVCPLPWEEKEKSASMRLRHFPKVTAQQCLARNRTVHFQITSLRQ